MAITSLAKTFDEFTVGEKMVFPLVTITEAHVVAWAGLSGDFNPLHMNQEYAKTTTTGAKVGGMVPHGQFIAAISVTPIGHLLAGTAIAFLDLSFQFKAPFGVGDTLYVEVEVSDKKPSTKYDGGMVRFNLTTRNQQGTAVIEGSAAFLVSRENTLKLPY